MSSAGVKDLCKVCDERGRGKGRGGCQILTSLNPLEEGELNQ